MPYRRSLSAPRYDEHGRDTWPALDEEQVRDEVLNPERDHGPHPQTHCQTCSKPLSARLLCHACGDETDDSTMAEVRPFGAPSGSEVGADPRPEYPAAEGSYLSHRSEVWIRPDAAEGIARVFDGDVGDRRRAEDQAA